MPDLRPLRLVPFALLALGCFEGEPRDPLPGGPSGPGATDRGLAFRIGGAGEDRVADVAVDAAGNVYVTGSFTGSVDFDPGPGSAIMASLGGDDGFVAKYTADHALLWRISLRGTGDELPAAIALDAAGNVLVAGSFDGVPDFDPGTGVATLTSAGGKDGFVLKLASSGDLLWVRRFGGPGEDGLADVVAGLADVVYAAGEFAGVASGAPGGHAPLAAQGAEPDGVLLAFNADGSPLAGIGIGGTGADRAAAVAILASGPAVAGSFGGSVDFDPAGGVVTRASRGGADVFLASYTPAPSLALSWVAAVGGLEDDAPGEGGLAVAPGDQAHLAGRFRGSVDFDPGAGTVTRQSLGGEDAFLLALDPQGAFAGVVAPGGTGADAALRVAVLPGGDRVLTGRFGAPVAFEPQTGGTVLVPRGTGGAGDLFVARYAPSGALVWARRFGDAVSGADRTTLGTGLALTAAGEALVGGKFYGNVDTDPGAALKVLASLGGADGFVFRLTAAGDLAQRP